MESHFGLQIINFEEFTSKVQNTLFTTVAIEISN